MKMMSCISEILLIWKRNLSTIFVSQEFTIRSNFERREVDRKPSASENAYLHKIQLF